MGSGGWSLDGIQIISSDTRDNVTTVVFNSTHLTSFAVLVDVAGGLEVIFGCIQKLLCSSDIHRMLLYVTLCIIIGCFNEGKAGNKDCVLHWVQHIHHLSLFNCAVLHNLQEVSYIEDS